MSDPKHYEVHVTPLDGAETYGTEVEITDRVRITGLSSIESRIDSDDYDFGAFLSDDLTLTAENGDGFFSSEMDSRSLFKFGRDKARVRVVFHDPDDSTDTLVYRGIVDERGTREQPDFNGSRVRLKVLSPDVVIAKSKVPSGAVGSGSSFSTAIANILDRAEITSVVSFSTADVSLSYNGTVDDGTWFDERGAREALDALLLASNSVLVVDRDLNKIVIRSRTANSGTVRNLYGPDSVSGQPQNLIELKEANPGRSKMFNVVSVDGTVASEADFVNTFGASVKTVELGFVTSTATRLAIAQALAREFRAPKQELVATVSTSLAKSWGMFDAIVFDVPLRTKPYRGTTSLPLYGQAKYGTAVYPYSTGGLKISQNVAYKIVGIKTDPDKFTTELRVRQVGTGFGDETIGSVASIYGFAVYGESVYTEDPDLIDPNVNSVYGAGKYGVTVYG